MLRHVLPRAGYAAAGLLWITIGLIAARIGFLGSRDRVAGMPGALRFLLYQKDGPWILGAVALGLAALAAWRGMQAASGRGAAITRAGQAAATVGYGALAWTAMALLLRIRRENHLGREGVAWLVAHPAGRLLLQAAGTVLLVAGSVAVVQAAIGRLPRWLVATGLTRSARRAALRVARLGLASRGIVMLVTGYFLFRAATDLDPREVREIGGSLVVLSRSPLGPLAMALVAAGLICYGLSMWFLVISRRPV